MTPSKERLAEIRERVEREHEIRMVGIGEMFPECKCGVEPPCWERDTVLALLAEVERLIAVVYPAPEQLTRMEQMARHLLEETQPPIYTEALAKHVLTLGAALRDRDGQLVTALAELERLAVFVERVRELCARGPGPSNEYQIWAVDVLAALDGDDQKASGT